MTTVYLAWATSGTETLRRHRDDGKPVNLLVAYPFLKDFLKVKHEFNIGQWCMDSGAFSVHHRGITIDLNEYIAVCRDVDATEIFGLDVIGSWQGTQRNLERMWLAGVKAIPTWHAGEPWEHLDWCARNADKIAISGTGYKKSAADWGTHKWLEQAMARVWPKKIHAFAQASERAIRLAPWHSVDASSWIYAPSAMGAWAGFTGKQMPVRARGVKDFWIEVLVHQKREAMAKHLWRRELALLEKT